MTDQVSLLINQLQLDAVIESIGSQRYTPAGILALDLVLQHQSEQKEAGSNRQVDLLLKAIAFDQLASEIQNSEMAVYYRFSGFLATRGRNKQILFHITRIEPI